MEEYNGSKQLLQLVEEYTSDHLGRKQNELNRFQNMASLEQVIREIFINERGNQYNHQRQGEATRERVVTTLLPISDDIQRCQSFDELFNLIQIQVQERVENVGEMFTYDAALRIGAFLGFLPETVYLIRGAREGATALGLTNRVGFQQVEDFPYELQSLQPHEIHHFLCVYSRRLYKI
jgi:hypothetical protein